MYRAFQTYLEQTCETVLWFPNFPNFAYQIWTWFERRLAWLPFRRCGFFAFSLVHVLESLHLADGFCDVSSHRWGQNLDSLNDPVRINDEATAHLNASPFIVNAVDFAHVAGCIRGHMPRDTSVNHLRQFVIVPHLVDEGAVYAEGNNLYTQVLKILIPCSNCCQFRGSDEGEIARVEAHEHPFPQVVR